MKVPISFKIHDPNYAAAINIENIRKMSTKNLKPKTSEKPLENLWFLVFEHILFKILVHSILLSSFQFNKIIIHDRDPYTFILLIKR